MRCLLSVWLALTLLGRGLEAAEAVRLRATADIWLSDANDQERNSSAGRCPRLKIKTIQEMAAIRFDAAPARGREIVRASLFLRRDGSDMLRYVRVSTVNQDWAEGGGAQPYGPPDGATFLWADAASRRPWAWPGSAFCDVIMTSGNSLAAWAERRELPDGWISVALTPELVYALIAGDTDGLAVMDGGTLAYHNNFVHSAQSRGNEPYIEVELGQPLTEAPAKPDVKVEPAPERAHLGSGAVKITIAEAKDVFCWRLTLDGKPVERWRVKHPEPNGPTVFCLEDLPPSHKGRLEIVAVARGGAAISPLTVEFTASPALAQPPALGEPKPVERKLAVIERSGAMSVWPCPALVKIDPEGGLAMGDDLGGEAGETNAVWDGQRILLFGARGEYVDYQLSISRLAGEPLAGVAVRHQPLKGPDGAVIGGAEIELFKNWYARNAKKQWQPAYCVPLADGAPFDIPDPLRKLSTQRNQTVHVDLYIPKDARPGRYAGSVSVEAKGVQAVVLPIELTVFDFGLPDRLSFWPELNAYRIPANAHDYYRLAHQHRCVANYWVQRARVEGSGKDMKVDWDSYDRNVGPLLSGEAFRGNRRAGVPIECMYLPFEDSWPTPLTPQTYSYQGHWPGRGENVRFITEHYLRAPYIGDGLSQGYRDAFLAVQRQFIAHFRERGWTRTEMQCFFGGKNTHRIQWGVNMWWTTDEPYHWDDWLALQFFLRLWATGRGDADPRLWAARGDISRPQWQGRVLAGAVDTVYFGAGAFSGPDWYRRCQTLARETGLKLMTYGSANRDTESNTRSVAWLLNVWLNGGNGALPWQTLGEDGALDNQDASAGGGNALIVPAKRFGLPVVGDLRLKALRDGQQLIEYLAILVDRAKLQREQVAALVRQAVPIEARAKAGAGADNAEALQFGTLSAWQIAELRRLVAERIVRGD